MYEESQQTLEKHATAGLVEELDAQVLRRNVSKVLEELDREPQGLLRH